MKTLNLNRHQFNRLFPFHLILGEDLLIQEAGEGLQQLFPEICGSLFTSGFTIISPQIKTYEFPVLQSLREPVLLQSLTMPGVLLQGQVEFLQEDRAVLFAVSPLLENSAPETQGASFAKGDAVVGRYPGPSAAYGLNSGVKELLERIHLQKNELEVNAQRLSKLITSMQTGILLEDEYRKIVLINQRFCQMFSIPVDPEEMKGWDCSASAQQSKHLFNDPERFVSQIDTILQRKEAVVGEVLELADGRYFERDYIPMFIEQEYRGHLWNYTDITERMRKEYAIRKSEEKYRGIITNINLGLIEVGLDETIQYVNQGFCKLSGYLPEELIGKKATDLLQVDEETLKKIASITERRKKGIADVNEFRVTTKNGEQRWWSISGAPLYADSGQVKGTIGIHMDITPQKNLEQNLREAKNSAEKNASAKENFMANMSHEIRTPLSGIYGMMQLLQHTRLDEEQKSYIEYIDKAIESLQTIINDILDFSKINAGMMKIEQLPFSVSDELNALYQLLLPRAAAKGLAMELEVDDRLSPRYNGDPHRINQVISNLVGNAIKFTQEGAIRIGCHCLQQGATQDELEFLIEDSGIGIDENFLESLFEKFTQEDMGHSRQFGGTGLGMSICKELTELMGGSIHVESKKNKGTKIRVRLPLEKFTKKPVSEKKIPSYGRLKGKKVLVAEDNDINAKVIKSMLDQEQADVTLVPDGKKLIDLLAQASFEIVISDLQMPHMNGLDAARWIRKHYPHPIHLVALTANALPEEKKRCRQAGFNQVLFKPFRKEDLLKACATTVNKTTAAPKTATPPQGLYDLNMLRDMVDHDPGQVQRLVEHFLRETPQKVEALKVSVKEKNHEEIKRIAHYLMSSVQHLNISSTYQPLKDLEQQVFIRAPKKMEQAVSEIEETLNAVMDQLKDEIQAMRIS